jgi:predicted ATP-grasp superfamily ATP-dependent carboligase
LLGREFDLASPFAYAGSIAPLMLRDEETAWLRKLGATLATRFGLVGLFGVDFVRTDDALWPIEVNPRYTASVEVVEGVTGGKFVAQHIAACRHGVLEHEQRQGSSAYFGKAIVFARRDGVVSRGIDALIDRWNGAERPGIADLPSVGQSIRAGHPVATVFADGASDGDVEQTLHARVKRVQSLIEP